MHPYGKIQSFKAHFDFVLKCFKMSHSKHLKAKMFKKSKQNLQIKETREGIKMYEIFKKAFRYHGQDV